MVRLELERVEDIESVASVPAGRYLCVCQEARERRRDDGTELWSLCWRVTSGPFAGRIAAWDSIAFTERALPRVKLLMKALGFSVGGTLQVDSQDIVGRMAWVTVRLEDYGDPATQVHRQVTKVPYAGYESAGEGGGNDPDQVPF